MMGVLAGCNSHVILDYPTCAEFNDQANGTYQIVPNTCVSGIPYIILEVSNA